MKKLTLSILLMGVVCSQAFGQASRFDGTAQTTTTVSATNTTVLVPLPGATVTVLSYPANGLPGTNKASVCPDATLVGCTTGAPNNPITADARGNFGFWIAAGTYDYTVCAPSGVCQGPYHVVLGSASGANGTFTVDGILYTTIQAAITAAGSTGYVVIPSNYAGVDTYTNPNKIQIQDRRPSSTRSRGYVNVLTDCGLKGSGLSIDGAAESAALTTCMAAYPTARLYFPPTNFANNCSYYFASSITPPVGSPAMVLTGGSNSFLNSTTQLGGTSLCFPAGVSGIVLQNCGCTIEYISILGSEGTQHLQNPSLLNIPSDTNLPLFTRSILTAQRAANVLTVNTSRVVNVEGLTQQVGSTVKISGVVGDATMNGLCVVATLVAGGGTATNPTQFTCAQNGADAGPFGAVGTVSLPTTGASAADGIRVCNNHTFINHVSIQGFGRHGINADSFGGHGCTVPFSDDLVLRDSFINDNQANGYLCYGVDCNAHLLSGNEIYYNVMWGIEDQSSLGNTHVGNQISNNSHFWASVTVPATKNITSVNRVSGTVAVVLATANPFIKLGTCVFNAGVSDATFNTPAGQCFFVNSFTDSTHFSYIQPGAPGDASSSGGTNRISTFAEAYLSSGVDDGAQKISTQSAVAAPVIINQYVEGGQICKWGPTVLLVGGANTPGCAQGVADWIGKFFTTQGCTGAGGTLCSNLGLIANNVDATTGLSFKGGLTADQDVNIAFLNHSGSTAWLLNAGTAGTLGSTSSYTLTRGSVRRFGLWGSGTSGGITRLNSESTGAIQLNVDANSGTGGWVLGSGGASPSTVATVDATGLGTFNAGVKAGSSGSTIADSRELIQRARSCGTTTTCANTANGSNFAIFGSVALSSGTPSTATITGISPAFTSSATYFCQATEATTATNNLLKVANVSGSSFTITGPNTITDTINYLCVGN